MPQSITETSVHNILLNVFNNVKWLVAIILHEMEVEK